MALKMKGLHWAGWVIVGFSSYTPPGRQRGVGSRDSKLGSLFPRLSLLGPSIFQLLLPLLLLLGSLSPVIKNEVGGVEDVPSVDVY